jgi:hypothetical protein
MTTTQTTGGTMHRIDPDSLTVIYTDDAGEDHDLNADGEPCTCRADLVDYICELLDQGAYDDVTCDDLLRVARAI